MLQEKIEGVLEEELNKRESLFLISCTVGLDHGIKIVLDGDKGVNLKDCIEVSRAIESQLDRDEIDFSLEVTSAGATTPLSQPRQYRKNLGRKLRVKTQEQQYEGNLTAADLETITLEWKSREPKPKGQGNLYFRNRRSKSIIKILT
jgi:ribosome maturation factor RimP